MIRPMLAATAHAIEALPYPMYASPKLDGIRAIKCADGLRSRTLKLIPNTHTQQLFASLPLWLDGELIVGNPADNVTFNITTSAITRREGVPQTTFHVFDILTGEPYTERLTRLTRLCRDLPSVNIVPQVLVGSPSALLEYETRTLAAGFEGVMLRAMQSYYKYGRSTFREAALLKLKRFAQSEAEVIGFVERMHNANDPTINALGYTERSHHQANLVPCKTLGALQVRDCATGIEFEIGTGFTDNDRAAIWAGRPLGKIVTYKHQTSGAKDKPRFPVFIGFRWD